MMIAPTVRPRALDSSPFLSRSSFTVLAIVLGAGEAHAYIDPGTGSMVLQAVIAGVATALVVIRLWWGRIKAAIGKLFGRRPANEAASAAGDGSIDEKPGR